MVIYSTREQNTFLAFQIEQQIVETYIWLSLISSKLFLGPRGRISVLRAVLEQRNAFSKKCFFTGLLGVGLQTPNLERQIGHFWECQNILN